MTETPTYESGDVVFGADPFKGGTASRPWLVISNHEGRPFHGDQYIVVTLTTKSWMDGLIPVDEESWVYGGTPEPSRIVPWGVQPISRGDIARWQGRLRDEILVEATEALIEEVRGSEARTK